MNKGSSLRAGKAFFISILFILCMQVFAPVLNVYADSKGHSWTEEADQSIYADEKGFMQDEDTSEEQEAGSAEKFLSSIVVSLGSGVNSLLAMADCDLDSIICGRVGSGAQTAMFTFELVSGNAYGTIASIAYTILRSVLFTWMVFILFGKLIKAVWSGGNGQVRNNFKEGVMIFCISFSLLFLLPYLLDLWLYLRDGLLHFIKSGFLEKMGNHTTLSLIGTFHETAETSGKITDALMYVGAVGITLWFVFDYVSMALSMMLFFTLFPFVAIQMNLDKKAIGNWCKHVFSMTITPILDIILLCIPLLFSVFFPNAWLIKMILCACIIPARRVAKNFLGLSSPGEGMLSAVSALMALRSASNMVKRTGSRVSNIGNKIKNGRADMQRARMESDLGAAEQSGMDSVMGRNGFSRMENDGVLDSAQEKGFGLGRVAKNFKFGEKRKSKNVSKGESVTAAEEYKSQVGNKDGYSRDMIMDRMNDKKRDLVHNNNAIGSRISALKSEKAKLEKDNAEMRLQDEEAGGYKTHGVDIARNNSRIADINTMIAGEEQNMESNKGMISDIDASLKNMGLSSSGVSSQISGGGSGAQGNNGLNERQLEVLRKHATIDNFENPEFAGLSHADKAELYKKRAKRQFKSAAVSATVGTVASAMGTAGAVALSSFYGPAITIGAADLGHELSGLGGNVVSAAISGIGRKSSSHLSKRSVPRYAPDVSSVVENPYIDGSIPNNGVPGPIIPSGGGGLSSSVMPSGSGGFLDPVMPSGSRALPGYIMPSGGSSAVVSMQHLNQASSGNTAIAGYSRYIQSVINSNVGKCYQKYSSDYGKRMVFDNLNSAMHEVQTGEQYKNMTNAEKLDMGATIASRNIMDGILPDILANTGISTDSQSLKQIREKWDEEAKRIMGSYIRAQNLDDVYVFDEDGIF